MSDLKIGIVGLPNAGKSTLFNALILKNKAAVSPHPFTTIDKNIGVVEVPDETLFSLAKMENIPKVTPATITFVDIAGLIKGAHLGEGLGNQFLHFIREVDLILHVLRFFKDENISHVHPKIDPEEDFAVVNEELLFADIVTIHKKLKKEKITTEEKDFLKRILNFLDQGVLASEINIKELTGAKKELEIFFKSLNLLTAKNQIIVANIGERDINNPPKKINGKEVLSICAKLESELNELSWMEAQQFLKSYGLKKNAKEKIILTCYRSLDLITFYTIAKRKEAKAWLLKKGNNVIEAAEKIHSDFAKYFVKVEVINIQELLKIGLWNKAREKGLIQIHGKDYQVKNGDVIEFKIAKVS